MRDISAEKKEAVLQRQGRLQREYDEFCRQNMKIGEIAASPIGLRHLNEIADLDGAGVVSSMTARDFRVFLMSKGLRQSEWPEEDTELSRFERQRASDQQLIDMYLSGADLK